MKSNNKTLVFQNNKRLNIGSLSNILPLIFTRKPLLIILFLSFFTSLQAQQQYTVKGNISGLKKEMKVFIQYLVGKEHKSDSAATKDGRFSIHGAIPRSLMVSLLFQSTEPVSGNISRESRFFYLSAGTTTISGNSLKSAVIKGGKEQDEYMELTSKAVPLRDSINKYGWNIPDKSKAKQFSLKQDSLTRQFIQTHNNSYVALDLVGQEAIFITDTKAFESLYNLLSTNLKNTIDGKKYAELLSVTKKLVIGAPAIGFTQEDANGKLVSLASLKGKFVLLEFWSSWCGWCRVEYPYIKKAYSQFKDKNFEIIGISLDNKKEMWIKAIKDNGFTWPQVCDLKGWKNAVAEKYAIYAIPQNFLIDPQGIIIAKELRGEVLLQKLEEVLNAQK
jgi:peroxiredoxin